MDNLSHALTGPVLTAVLSPELFARYKKRAMLASAVVINLPDADIVLALMGEETYFFHHRGITHSIVGLIFMVPIGMWVFNKIMGKAYCTNPTDCLSIRKQITLVTTLMVIGHFFLDYLTTWGTMLLYPLTMDRFAFPLMFIIDPRYWLIGIGACIALIVSRASSRAFTIAGWGAVVIVCAYWGLGISAKVMSESVFRANSTDASSIVDIESYPAQSAPKVWAIVATHQSQAIAGGSSVTGGESLPYYTQAIVEHGPFPYKDSKYFSYPITQQYYHDQLCSENEYGEIALRAFENYKKWSEKTVCEVARVDGQSGCQCSSLKYFIPALNGNSDLGSYWIAPDGQAHMVSRFR